LELSSTEWYLAFNTINVNGSSSHIALENSSFMDVRGSNININGGWLTSNMSTIRLRFAGGSIESYDDYDGDSYDEDSCIEIALPNLVSSRLLIRGQNGSRVEFNNTSTFIVRDSQVLMTAGTLIVNRSNMNIHDNTRLSLNNTSRVIVENLSNWRNTGRVDIVGHAVSDLIRVDRSFADFQVGTHVTSGSGIRWAGFVFVDCFP